MEEFRQEYAPDAFDAYALETIIRMMEPSQPTDVRDAFEEFARIAKKFPSLEYRLYYTNDITAGKMPAWEDFLYQYGHRLDAGETMIDLAAAAAASRPTVKATRGPLTMACATCSEPTTSRCPACPANKMYCSTMCQAADWGAHRAAHTA